MKSYRHTPTILVSALMLVFASASFAADPPKTTTTTTTTAVSTTTEKSRLVDQYTTLAGSTANAESLISGLRNGSSLTLAAPTATSGATTTGGTTATGVTFTPASGKLGYGEVNIALSLASAELLKLGITNPTAEQLKTVLNGGTITTTTAAGTTTTPTSTSTKLTGILTMRADKMGWGQIANSLGIKLGDVMRNEKADSVAKDGSQVASEKSDGRAAKADKVSRPDKVERPVKLERPEKVERPERPERPERAGK